MSQLSQLSETVGWLEQLGFSLFFDGKKVENEYGLSAPTIMIYMFIDKGFTTTEVAFKMALQALASELCLSDDSDKVETQQAIKKHTNHLIKALENSLLRKVVSRENYNDFQETISVILGEDPDFELKLLAKASLLIYSQRVLTRNTDYLKDKTIH